MFATVGSMQKRYVLQVTSTATRLMAFATLFTASALLPLANESGPAPIDAPGAHRGEVVAMADPHVTESLTSHYPQEAATDGDPQCLALDGLVQTIDEQLRQPWPAARREELQAMRQRARDEQLRLLC